MKKLIAMAMVLAGGVALAEDSYLYWAVNPYAAEPDNPNAVIEFDYAYLRVVDQGGKVVATLDNYYYSGDKLVSYGQQAWANAEAGNLPDSAMTGGDGAWFANLGSYAGQTYGYMVEAYLDGDGGAVLVGSSPIASYLDLLNARHISTGGTAMSGDYLPWTTAVPEPTSGLLLLLGLAGLALRRKRVEVEV